MGEYVGALKDISSNRTSTETDEDASQILITEQRCVAEQRTHVGWPLRKPGLFRI